MGDNPALTTGGPGTPTTGFFNAGHAYADDGVYTVSAKIRDDDMPAGTWVEQTFEVTVNNVAPTLDADGVGADEAILPPAEGAFSRSGITFNDPGTLDVHTVDVDWDGDGNVDQSIAIPLGDRTFDLAHTFTTDGTFNVDVTLRDDDLGFVSDTFIVTVSLNDPPEATAISAAGAEDNDVLLTLSGTDPDGDPLTATISTLPTAGALFQTTDGVTRGAAITTAGTQVTDSQRRVIFAPAADQNGTAYAQFGFIVNDGTVDSAEAVATVSVTPVNDAPVIADGDLSLSAASIIEGSSVTLTGSFADVESDDAHTVTIDWGDGSAATVLNLRPVCSISMRCIPMRMIMRPTPMRLQ